MCLVIFDLRALVEDAADRLGVELSKPDVDDLVERLVYDRLADGEGPRTQADWEHAAHEMVVHFLCSIWSADEVDELICTSGHGI